MSRETDAFQGAVSSTKAWEAKTWPTAFAAAPIAVIIAIAEKKKSGVRNVTSTGADVSSEVTDYSMMLAENNGYQDAGNAPESDAGKEVITNAKSFQSASFNGTFTSAPIVICGYEGSTAGGKKVSQTNVTTTGFDIANEETQATTWLAVKQGAYSG